MDKNHPFGSGISRLSDLKHSAFARFRVISFYNPYFMVEAKIPHVMSWIKNALIDLAITAVIAVYAFNGATWGWCVIAIYTPLMVLLKVFALSGAASAVQRKADEVPLWFYHLLFAANVILLFVADFNYAAFGWVAIWLLSVLAESRSRPKKGS